MLSRRTGYSLTFAPEGPARPQSDRSPQRRASSALKNNSGSSAAHLVHHAFLLFPKRSRSLGTREQDCVWTAHVSSQPLLAPTGRNGDGREGLQPPYASPHA